MPVLRVAAATALVAFASCFATAQVSIIPVSPVQNGEQFASAFAPFLRDQQSANTRFDVAISRVAPEHRDRVRERISRFQLLDIGDRDSCWAPHIIAGTVIAPDRQRVELFLCRRNFIAAARTVSTAILYFITRHRSEAGQAREDTLAGLFESDAAHSIEDFDLGRQGLKATGSYHCTPFHRAFALVQSLPPDDCWKILDQRLVLNFLAEGFKRYGGTLPRDLPQSVDVSVVPTMVANVAVSSTIEALFDFVISHELGHVALDHLSNSNLDVRVSQEISADQFAISTLARNGSSLDGFFQTFIHSLASQNYLAVISAWANSGGRSKDPRYEAHGKAVVCSLRRSLSQDVLSDQLRLAIAGILKLPAVLKVTCDLD